MRVVVALGGNALLRGGPPRPPSSSDTSTPPQTALAPLARDHDLVICHGNGPQIGLLALERQTDPALHRPYPLDVLGAATQGLIGYWLAQSLRNAGVSEPVATIVSQVLVDASDAAFTRPTKFVGPGYPHDRARHLADTFGWTVAADGPAWRRVVASPEPQRLVEQDVISALSRTGAVVICGGGGGAPVVADRSGRLTGVEAVVDKDLTAALLATTMDADRLLVLTDVPAVMAHFGTPQATALTHLDVDADTHLAFPAGSMGPKIDACRRFIVRTGRSAAIGALSDADAVLAGAAGTKIRLRPPDAKVAGLAASTRPSDRTPTCSSPAAPARCGSRCPAACSGSAPRVGWAA
jgi:carbamate kinase